MTVERDGTTTMKVWRSSMGMCAKANNASQCNSMGTRVSKKDGDLACAWTAYPDWIENNKIRKRVVGKFGEGVGEFFVGEEHLAGAACHVSGKSSGIQVE